MRKRVLLAGVAALALSSPALASPHSDVDNVQVNALTGQVAVGDVLHNTASKLDISTTAVGNALNVDVTDKGKTADVSNLQVNALSGQFASTDSEWNQGPGHTSDLKITATTVAVGNSFGSQSAGSLGTVDSLQVNALAVQDADGLFINDWADKGATITTAAIGNNVGLTGSSIGNGHSVLLQANFLTGQFANTTFDNYENLDTVTTQAVGNNISLTTTGEQASASIGQVNALTKQVAVTELGPTWAGANNIAGVNTTIDTAAVGNNLSVDAHDDATIRGGQGNILTKQVAITDFGKTGGDYFKNLDVTTAALGNSASISGKDVVVGGGNLPLVGDDFVQVNALTKQFAFTDVDGGVNATKSMNFTTAAIGNNLNIQGTSFVNADVVQANFLSPQVAISSIHGANAGSMSVATQAIGNAVSVTVGH